MIPVVKQLVGIFLATCVLAGNASAQSAASLAIPANVRGEGAGRALSFLDRGAGAAWGNVGGVAFADGFEGFIMRTHLVPSLADVVFDHGSIAYGFVRGGRSLALNANYTNLDYGPGVIGSGSFLVHERTFGLSGGIEIADGIGVGAGIKSFRQRSMGAIEPDTRDETSLLFDLGVLGFLPLGNGPTDIFLDGGVSVHNLGSDIETGGAVEEPPPQVLRVATGLEVHSATGSELGYGAPFDKAPIVSLRPALALEKDLYDSGPEETGSFWERNDLRLYLGGELQMLNFLTARYGYIHDDGGEIKGNTWGWGVSLLSFGGVDYASIPQFEELPRVSKWAVWFRISSL
jgi:hypothetical protein